MVVTKSIYKLCWYKHIFPDKMLVVTGTVYTVCWSTTFLQDFLVGSNKKYIQTLLVTNILSGKICSHEQNSYALFVTTNKKILENMLLNNTNIPHTIYIYIYHYQQENNMNILVVYVYILRIVCTSGITNIFYVSVYIQMTIY